MGRTRTANKGLPPRLIVRKWKSRGSVVIAYYYDGRENGKRIFIALGQDRDAALRKWAELEGVKPSASGTFDSVADRYVKEVLPLKPKATQADYSNSIGMLRKVFGPHPLESVKTKHLAQYRDTRKAKIRANREIAMFSILWNIAREWGVTDLPNPCPGLKRNKETPRERLVTKEEYTKLYQHADQLTRDALDLAYFTAQRPADVLKMKHSDIFKTVVMVEGQPVEIEQIRVKQNKTKKIVNIDVVGRLAALIAKLKERARNAPIAHFALLQTEKGRPLTAGMLRGRFGKARKLSGVNFEFRDLRPMGLTAQPSLEGARLLGGHSTPAITNRVYRRGGERAKPNE